MTDQTSAEVAVVFDRLPAARREQVVEYARWLRANPDASLPGGRERGTNQRHAQSEGCSPARRAMNPRATELEREVHGLTCAQRALVVEYVTALAEGRGVPGHTLRRFAGTIAEDVLNGMERIVEEEFERIDHAGW